MSGAKSRAGGAGERTGPQVWARGRWKVPACPPWLWVTVLSPAHSYPSVTPNPSWATAPLGQAVYPGGREGLRGGEG